MLASIETVRGDQMLVGTMEEVDAFLHTTPWGLEQTVGFYNWTLDGEMRWSVMLTSDPTNLDSEGIIFGTVPGRNERP
jgi:hypothetical protein